MDILWQAVLDALRLLGEADAALVSVVWLTLRVSGGALAIAVVLGVPVGAWLGLRERVPLAGCLLPLIYTGMGLPPVVVGLAVYCSSPIRGRWGIGAGCSPPRP
jgi:tungstate transport system permease protein